MLLLDNLEMVSLLLLASGASEHRHSRLLSGGRCTGFPAIFAVHIDLHLLGCS